MRELLLLWGANADLQNAFEYYEDQEAGLGEKFTQRVESALAIIRQFPESAPIYRGRHRRRLLKKFPYGVFYTIYPTRISVSAILDTRLDPKVIMRRLKES